MTNPTELIARVEAALEGVTPPFIFDRYINGVLMAEGVTIERQTDLASAAAVAARIASRGPNGEPPVLVHIAAARQDVPDLLAELKAVMAERERLALAICGGEDAPGYANAQPVEALERVAQQNRSNAMAIIDRMIAAEAEVAALRAQVAELEGALIWCGGSADFQEGGIARKGWLKLCTPLIFGDDALRAKAKEARDE